MPHAISFSARALKALDRMPEKHALQVRSVIHAYAQAPHTYPSEQLTPKRKSAIKLRRLTAGEYRVIVHRRSDGTLVVLIAKRNDDEVYRLLDRLH